MRTRTKRGFFRDWCGVEAGMGRGGGEQENEGQRPLFLFQLDRIGTPAREEEMLQILSRDGRPRCD